MLRARPRADDRAERSPASTASSTSPGSRACGASATSSRPTCAATSSRRSACSRRRRATRVRVVFASSSSVYGDAERYPTPEDAAAAAALAVRDHEARLRAPRRARTARSFGLDAVVLRYFNVYGPRQRPDMAFTRIVTALAEGRPFELYGDGSISRAASPTSPTSSPRPSRRWSAATGADLQRRRRCRGDDEATRSPSRADRRPRARASRAAPVARVTSAARTPTRRGSAPTSAGSRRRARGRPAGAVGVGVRAGGRRVSTPSSKPRPLPDLDAEQEVDVGRYWARVVSRWWLPLIGLCVGILVGYLISVGGGKVYRAEALLYLGQPFSPDSSAPVFGARHGPEDGQRDRPLGDRPQAGGTRQRPPARRAARQGLDDNRLRRIRGRQGDAAAAGAGQRPG